jgi:hypothetical protein
VNRKFILLVVLLLIGNNLFAKNDTTNVSPWHTTASTGLNISQISFRNWSQGGENSLTWTAILNTGIKYSANGWEFKDSLKVAYGRTKLGGQDFRTNNNELSFETILSKHIGWAVDPYLSNSIRTSLTTGYSYSSDSSVAIADFFDPGYITQSLGFTYGKTEIFKSRLGLAVQETFTDKYRQYTSDTTLPDRKAFKCQTGFESVTNGEVSLVENIKLQSSLRLFTTFESLDVWDVRWENVLTGKINSFLNMNFSYLLIYQKDQSLRTQMKEGLNVGFVYNIL